MNFIPKENPLRSVPSSEETCLSNFLSGVLIFGIVAQLGERRVRNAEVEGSNPFGSTRRREPFGSWRISFPDKTAKALIWRNPFFRPSAAFSSRPAGRRFRIISGCRRSDRLQSLCLPQTVFCPDGSCPIKLFPGVSKTSD